MGDSKYCLKGWHYRYGRMPIKVKSAFYSYGYGCSRKRSLKILRMCNKRIPARVLKRVFVESIENHKGKLPKPSLKRSDRVYSKAYLCQSTIYF